MTISKGEIDQSRYKYRIKQSDKDRIKERRQSPVYGHLWTHIGINIVLTNEDGWRFIRVPRHRLDERPPYYVDPDSVEEFVHAD